MNKPKACEGGVTVTCGNFEECQHCERLVNWKFTDHWFFGFSASCDQLLEIEAVGPTISRQSNELLAACYTNDVHGGEA